MADSINNSSTHPDILNMPIALNEVISVIKSLKSGKASSIDMVSNEILKHLDTEHQTFLTNYFNICFDTNIYPWNESVITPLHKTGQHYPRL